MMLASPKLRMFSILLNKTAHIWSAAAAILYLKSKWNLKKSRAAQWQLISLFILYSYSWSLFAFSWYVYWSEDLSIVSWLEDLQNIYKSLLNCIADNYSLVSAYLKLLIIYYSATWPIQSWLPDHIQPTWAIMEPQNQRTQACMRSEYNVCCNDRSIARLPYITVM